MTKQDLNSAGILIQMVTLPAPVYIQYLKQQVYVFTALITKATFPKFSHHYLLIPRGYVQKSCCINAKKHRILAGVGSSGSHPAWHPLGSTAVPVLDQVSLWLCLANSAKVDTASVWNCPLPCFHGLVYKMIEYICNSLVTS